MVIDAECKTKHLPPMATKTESLLPEHIRIELRPEKVGRRLEMLREALGLSSSQIADSLGIQRTYWSRFETGKRVVTEEVAALLCDRFGVTMDFLYLGRWNGLPLSLAERMRDFDSRNS